MQGQGMKARAGGMKVEKKVVSDERRLLRIRKQLRNRPIRGIKVVFG